MKLLLVLSSDETLEIITRYTKPLGFEIIRYTNVLKAMDNIDEADPSGIIISARDYPRHWKALVQFIRTERPKNVCPIVILKGKNFDEDQMSKADYLGVSGTADESFEDHNDLSRIQEILCQYLSADDKSRSRHYKIQPWHRLNFVFVMSKKDVLITGAIKTISSTGISFLPDHSAHIEKIFLNDEFNECSLRVGDNFLSPKCRLIRTGKIISMEFIDFAKDGEFDILNDYLILSPLKDYRQTEKTAE